MRLAEHPRDLFAMDHKPSGRSAGSFEGALLMLLIWLGAFIAMLAIEGPGWLRTAVMCAGLALGAGCGWGVSTSFRRRRERRRAAFESEYRDEQEREFQRKLAEAMARGEIR